MTLSESLRSMVRTRRGHPHDNAPPTATHYLAECRESLSPVEVSVPVSMLGDAGVARWVREHRVTVEVISVAELCQTVSAGIGPDLLTVYTDGFDAADVGGLASLGPGRVVIGCVEHVDIFGGSVEEGRRSVVLRMRESARSHGTGFDFDSRDADMAVERVLAHPALDLIGLHCDVGSADDDSAGYSAAIGDLLAQMEHIRRRFGLLLTRLGLGGGRFVCRGVTEETRRALGAAIDAATDDACATLRFPRPVVTVALTSDDLERCAS